MTDFEKTQLKTLLWKEWRQINAVAYMGLFVIVIMTLMPWFLERAGKMWEGFAFGTLMASLLACFGAGVVSYGMEFNDRTQAYLSTRPVSHRQRFWAKMGVGLAVVWFFNLLALNPFSRTTLFDLFKATEPGLGVCAGLTTLVYLTVQFFILLIPPMVPALIFAISAGMWGISLALVLAEPLSIWAASIVLGFLTYFLSRWRLRGPGW
jgi:hypothetical protein